MAGVQAESRSICSPKVEPRLPLGRLRSTSQSVTIWAKKKVFWSSGSFFVLFFYWLFFGFLFPHLSVVCLSHLVFMPQTWHMPSPYPHPSIHVSNLTNPCVHTVLSPPKLTVLCFVSPFPGWGGQGDTACVTIVHSECWKRYFSTPPSLPYYTFLSSYLFVSLCRCLF